MKTCQGIPGQRAPARDTNHAPPLAEMAVEPATSGQLNEMKVDENEGSLGCAMLVLVVVVVAAVTAAAAAIS